MTESVIDLIRHGEPVGGRKYRGQIDDPLSAAGWQQMRSAVGDHQPWQHIISSPLIRCVEFAKELSTRHQIDMSVNNDLMEIGFGDWEGKTAEQIESEIPGQLKHFYSDPVNNRPAGAEPLQDFMTRISVAIDDTIRQHHGKHILIVCHAGVIRMTLAHILGLPMEHAYRIQVANAGITRFVIDHQNGNVLPRLIFHGGSL